MSKKKWQDLGTPAQVGIIAAGGLQLGLFAIGLIDLSKRSAGELNGPKRLWIAVIFVNFAGPISYFLFGRRRSRNKWRSRTAPGARGNTSR